MTHTFLDSPALTMAMALAAGMISQVVARHVQVPGIVLLLLAGVLLGPEGAGLVRPETLGGALDVVVGMSVAVILFEGGLNLSLHRLRQEAVVIRRLITVGAVITALGAALAARLFMGWPWELSVPFGTLVIVTGPTVITPLMRRIQVNRNLSTILEGEGVLIDALGAIGAVVALEIVLTTTATEAATGLLGLPTRLLVGGGFGLAGGIVIGILLRREELVPEGLENVFALSMVLALFELSEAVLPESGILTAALAGLVVGNMETRVQDELKEFKEQLTILLIGLLFVLLAATVEMEDVLGLGWGGIATVLVLILVLRPLNVAVSTAGSTLKTRERLFLAWLAPRGIVAAAVASLFARWLEEAGVPGGMELQALVFLVIAVTVVIQGGLAGVVASALGVRRERDRGFVIVGANPIGRTLARALEVAGQPVVLVDSSAPECSAAEREGLNVVMGNAAEERTLLRAEIHTRRGLITVTRNQAVNLLVAGRAAHRFHPPHLAVALNRRYRELEPAQVHEEGAEVLFREPVDLEFWSHELLHGSVDITAWEYAGERPVETRPATAARRVPVPGKQRDDPDEAVTALPLVVQREGEAYPITDNTVFRTGDVAYFAWTYASGETAGRWLSRHGWRPYA